MGDVLTLLVLALPLLGFWFLLIRPAQRRQRELAELRSRLTVGQEVVTTSGLFGTIRAVRDDVVHLEVADGVVLRFTSGAVATVLTPGGDAGGGAGGGAGGEAGSAEPPDA